jgi:hypothetical protein
MRSTRRNRSALAVRRAAEAVSVVGLRGALAAILAAAACLPGSGPALKSTVDDAGSPPGTIVGDDGGSRLDVDLGPAFAITGLQPSHGPWTGGTRTTVAGRGFSSQIQVWIGGTQLDASAVFASDPTHAAVVTPPGSPGPVDVRVRNTNTAEEAVLPAGFTYDAFSVTPSGGSTTGGTRIALRGVGTHWTQGSTVSLGGKPCTGVTLADATDLTCSTPPNGPGSQDVTVTNPDGTLDQALDAFLYSESPDGYRGGLYGGVLSGTLEVLGFDSWTGAPLAGGKAIAGSTLAGAVIGTLDPNGVAQLSGPSLAGHVTVTVVAKCHQPMTFVDVPVDTVTAYLDPELDPSCAGDPPSSGNYNTVALGEIDGELVWPGGIEFERGPWSNVPMPSGPNERQAAYVFTAAGSPFTMFGLPGPSTATTPMSGGRLGYAFTLSALPGNQTAYALAGLEDRSASPPRFQPYAMGVVSGVPVLPGAKTVGAYISMSTTFDRALTTVPEPPASTPRGPDRLLTILAIDIGETAYAVLPQGTATNLLPLSGSVPLVGIPALDGSLANARYNLSAAAVTGTNLATPASVVTGIETTDANDPITLGGFLPVPTLAQPGNGSWNGTHVALQAGGPVDLAYIQVSSGAGLVTWQIIAPGSDLSFDLPDLGQIAGVGSLVHGHIQTTFWVARVSSFDYGTLRSGQLSPSAWNAYAEDTTSGTF